MPDLTPAQWAVTAWAMATIVAMFLLPSRKERR